MSQLTKAGLHFTLTVRTEFTDYRPCLFILLSLKHQCASVNEQ